MKDSPNIVLAGGNGYIGGTTAFALRDSGFRPFIFDNFSTSKKGALASFEVINVELLRKDEVRTAFRKLGAISGIIHFAAKALVPESFQHPYQYFENNLMSSLVLVDLAKEFGIPVFIHSSSCAVYGIPQIVPIPENAPLMGHSPYGTTKVLSELLLNSYATLGNPKICHLRYFNPAGADLKNHWGEKHEPETHLIPNLVQAAIAEKEFFIFGDEYSTPDGTCVRDFIHVSDLAEAHVRTLQALLKEIPLPQSINIGTGKGTSVREVVQTTEKVFKKPLRVSFKPPRPGDPPQLVAETSLMRKHLNWEPKKSVEQMIFDDWSWRIS